MIRFSVICPAIRPRLYKMAYDSLNYKNNTSFEMVFCGNKPPAHDMPSNFHYVVSDKNASYCLEIAARKSKGEFIIVTADDCLYSEHYLDKIDGYLKKFGDKKVMVGTRYQANGKFIDERTIFGSGLENPKVVGGTVAYHAKTWHDLGGIDRRFEGGCSDADMYMRFLEVGYEPFLAKDVWINEIVRSKANRLNGIKRLWKRTGNQGMELCNKFWCDGKRLTEKRKEQVLCIPKDIS